MARTIKQGWFRIAETQNLETLDYELVIKDLRSRDVVCLNVDNIEAYNEVLDFLAANQSVGSFLQLAA